MTFRLIAGPCVIEDAPIMAEIAAELLALRDARGIDVVFKASFDKANRARYRSYRGTETDPARQMAALRRVLTRFGVPVLTDIHEPGQAEMVRSWVDYIQIPAFLCRQTDLVEAAARTLLPLNIKKGQWMAPEEMGHVFAKVLAAGGPAPMITERGTAHGYGDLVVDMRSFERMRRACGGGVRVLYDASHSVQHAGARAGSSGGDPEFIRPLALAAVAAGCDGLYIEVHPDPGRALSDPETTLPLAELAPLVRDAMAIRAVLEEKVLRT